MDKLYWHKRGWDYRYANAGPYKFELKTIVKQGYQLYIDNKYIGIFEFLRDARKFATIFYNSLLNLK